jgi:hypothetical protein
MSLRAGVDGTDETELVIKERVGKCGTHMAQLGLTIDVTQCLGT